MDWGVDVGLEVCALLGEFLPVLQSSWTYQTGEKQAVLSWIFC